ncbi:MAG: NBR1-Ig-like domain-containing protein [Candidatus Promineifilaceae bacterium]
MNYYCRRWWLLALLLFLLFVIPACRSTPVEVLDTPSPQPSEPAQIVDARPSPTTMKESTAKPLPTVSFEGIQFTFDEATLGPLGTTVHHPPVPPGEDYVQPEHLEIQLKAGDLEVSPVLYIFPVQQYEALSETAAGEIAELRTILAERPSEIEGALPFLPMYEAVESYHSDPKYIDFQNGSGISFLTNVDHDNSLATNDSLFYTYQGLTEDGRYYVATLVPISNVSSDEADNPIVSDGYDGAAVDHSAKAQIGTGNWISVDLGDGRSLIDDMMSSLLVQPDESFPTITLPIFFTAKGLVLGYDQGLSGVPSIEYSPAILDSPNGEVTLLTGVPDFVTVRFHHQSKDSSDAELQIQPVRDETGHFFEAIPEWQQKKTISLEDDDLGLVHLLDNGPVSDLIRIAYQNGSGFRGVTAAGDGSDISAAQEYYIFNGMSADGRYMVRLRHPLPTSTSHEEALSYIDDMVKSLTVAEDVSTGSSMPVNSTDCENDAEFVEDISIPDYTVVERDDTFVKIWRVRNTGTCTWTPTYKSNFSQGNPLEWQAMAIAEIVPPGEETEVSVSVQSPDIPGIYQTWWQLSDEQGQNFGDRLGVLFEAPKPATDIPGYGVIEGDINYPAAGNPAIDIYFLNIENNERYSMRTEQGWTRFSNAVPIGTYHVFGRVVGDSSDSGGGFTEAVICGLHAGCNDHDLVDVLVQEGRANHDVNLFDWYAPAGSFPLPQLN